MDNAHLLGGDETMAGENSLVAVVKMSAFLDCVVTKFVCYVLILYSFFNLGEYW